MTLLFHLGGRGGITSGMICCKKVRTIQFRYGKYVDAIIINDKQYGGSGGKLSNLLELKEGEFISDVNARAGKYLDYLKLSTNRGQMIEGGGKQGNNFYCKGILTGIQVCFGNYIDSIIVKIQDSENPYEYRIL